MAVLMFQERFADLVQSGAKRQTIRPRRKRPIVVGESLSLRKWSGKAYRTKQVKLKETVCANTSTVLLHHGPVGDITVSLNAAPLSFDDSNAFAKADGFTSLQAMFDWFENTHGLPFEGDLIQW